VYLDGVHFSIRHGDKADATIILTAVGVDLAGNKEVLARRSCAEEDKDGWVCEARKICEHEERLTLI
jgi:putative transposase